MTIVNITEGKLAKRRNHNAYALCMWVQRGYIAPRKEAALAGILFALRTNKTAVLSAKEG